MLKTTFIILAWCIIGGVIFSAGAQTRDGRLAVEKEKMVDSNELKNNAPLLPLENPLIVVKKKKRRLYLYDGKKLVKTYIVGLGFAPVGDKEKEGDGKTPEGEFYIFTKNPKSSFYLSLGVSYPNIEDAKRGLKEELITKDQHDAIVKAVNGKKSPLQKTRLGGEIYIHGNGSATDWTWGCVALENAEMKELFELIPVGAKVRIEP
jgi:murein L,D-transpeptidase YafK